MKNIKYLLFCAIMCSFIFAFNSFAMPKNQYAGEPVAPTPMTETKYDDASLNYVWVWLNDDLCVRSNLNPFSQTKERLQKMFDMGAIAPWYENGELKKRDTYAGRWSQSTDGIWSFEYDDKTIPVGVTKIDGTLYAFNGYGELKEGYTYYGDFKTAADGLASSTEPEYLKWLETQYVPECTSHE